MTPAEDFDVFLSHGSPDKPWVDTLASELKALGLKPFLDVEAIESPENFVRILNEGIARSRFLVLILSPHSDRAWVRQEWTSFLAHHGPEGRLVPVLLESTPVPALLAPVQRIDATDRDAARVAWEIARIAGRPGQLPEGDTRRLVLGEDLVFSLEMDGDDLRVTDPTGRVRKVTPPWKVDNKFGLALHFYERLTREPVTTDSDRADLFTRATTVGSLLFDVLFDEEGKERLRQAMVPGRPRPLITIRSEDDGLLALPWELLCQEGSFLLRDARVDLSRSIPSEGGEALAHEPDNFLKLVVNVSAPEGRGFDYEGESYRLAKALSEYCRFVPTELGTSSDLVEMVRLQKPTAIHFSGHGAPGALVFEDEEGWPDVVPIRDLLHKLLAWIDGPLPPLFYLASCHGNDTGGEKAETSAAHLHREGVLQVVGYDGPIVDELSTRAEVAFYRALAEGGTTRYAVRQAREALAAPFGDPGARHRLRSSTKPGEEVRAENPGTEHTHPFAWAQLVFYHRGPDYPLSLPSPRWLRETEEALRRTFTGFAGRRVLATGFIGRRSEMHEVRRRIRRGDRVLVFQGLGGLGKSTLALHILPMLQRDEGEILVLWCQEVEQQPNRLEGLVSQLLDHCRKRFGLEWEQVVHQVDRMAGDDPLQRFTLFLQVLLQNVPRLVLYLDNLESLQVGPKDSKAEGDAEAIGEWVSESLDQLWGMLTTLSEQVEHLYLVASCRYRNPDFAGALLPVSPLAPDALFRMMSWFPALRRLNLTSRSRLVERLAGHPRAVEYVDDLLAHALADYEGRHGSWQGGEDPEHEWTTLVEPVLPKLRGKLQANLLLAEIWTQILAERERRMLYRMTLLRQPWEWPLMALLGEEGEEEEVAFATAERLRRTSLLEQVEFVRKSDSGKLGSAYRFNLHPATVQLVREFFSEDDGMRRIAHRRLGDYLEGKARTSTNIEVDIEAGYHLFQAGEYDRACDLLAPASGWLQDHGRVREGLRILEPFLAEQVKEVLAPQRLGRLLGSLGVAHYRLGEVEKAVEYYQQSLIISREVGDRQGEGRAQGNLGLAYADLGEVSEAIRYCEQQLLIAREIGNRREEGDALGNLGVAWVGMGDVQKAIDYFEQQLVIARETGNLHGESMALGNLGNSYSLLGDVVGSLVHYEQQLTISREIGDRRGEGNALGNLGRAYSQLDQREKAISYYEQALSIARDIGDRRGEGSTLGNLGIAYADLGETEKANTLLQQALAIGQIIKDSQITRIASTNLARMAKGGTNTKVLWVAR